MAKNELGLNFGTPSGGDVFIDTESGKIITATPKKEEPIEEPEGGIKKDENLIEIPDKKEEEGAAKDDKSSIGENVKDGGDSSSLPTYKVLAKALHEKGILSDFDEKVFDDLKEGDDPTDKIFELISNEINKNVDDKFNDKYKDYPEDVKKMITAGGEQERSVKDVLSIRNTIEQFNQFDTEKIEGDEKLQESLVVESLKQRGYSDEKIAKRIEQFKNLGELENEAKDSVSEIIDNLKKEEKDLIKEAKERDDEIASTREKSIKDLKKSIFGADHIVDGMTMTDKEKQIVFDSMTKVVDKDENGNPLNSVMVTRSKNPIEFEKALHYYHALGLFNIDKDGNFKPDLSKIKSSAKSSAIDELGKVLKTEQRTQTGRPARENKMDREKLKERISRMKNAHLL